jgi:hypothetical protein
MKLLAVLILSMSFGIASAETTVINAERFTVKLSDKGDIIGITLSDGAHRSVFGKTLLADTRVDGPVVMKQLPGGGIRFTKKLICDQQNRSCILREQFQPVGDSVRWEIDIVGSGRAWSTAIETQLLWPTPKNAAIWVAGSGGKALTKHGWNDPLVPIPFAESADAICRKAAQIRCTHVERHRGDFPAIGDGFGIGNRPKLFACPLTGRRHS